MPARCGSSRSVSTARRRGPSRRRCPPSPPRRMTRRRNGRQSRSSARSPRTRPPGSDPGPSVPGPGRELEAAVVRHHTSRAGDPHRHLHLQINARVFAAGGWRGLDWSGRSTPSLRSTSSATPRSRATRSSADLDRPRLHPRPRYRRGRPAGAVRGGVQRPRRADRPQRRPYEAAWRGDHPGRNRGRPWSGPGTARLGRCPSRQGRPRRRRRYADRWVEDLTDLGFTPPRQRPTPAIRRGSSRLAVVAAGRRRPTESTARAVGLDGDGAIGTCTATSPPTWCWRGSGSTSSAWNAADIRGKTEQIMAARPVDRPRRFAMSRPGTSPSARSPGASVA